MPLVYCERNGIRPEAGAHPSRDDAHGLEVQEHVVLGPQVPRLAWKMLDHRRKELHVPPAVACVSHQPKVTRLLAVSRIFVHQAICQD
eukprot:1041744-Prymnesium_polylepis.2